MPELYIGLLSGTSVDAIDSVLVDLSETPRIVASHTHAIPTELRERLNAMSLTPDTSLAEYAVLDSTLGELFAEAAIELLRGAKVERSAVTGIGSHGLTVFHFPDGEHSNSLQIGNPNIIVERTGITTVADMRRRDMAAGGQGAPLVPAFHEAVFRIPDRRRAIVNIGGIANITCLPADASEAAIGFDCGPGNTLLDQWIMRQRGEACDRDGEWARSGRTSAVLLERLMADAYFARRPPKSTGKEYFNLEWLTDHLTALALELPPVDVQATLVEVSAKGIALGLRQCIDLSHDELFFCGGGVHNTRLMGVIADELGLDAPLSTTAALGIDPDWVEAAAFAWLACRTLAHRPGNLTAVTGARHPVVLGAIYGT